MRGVVEDRVADVAAEQARRELAHPVQEHGHAERCDHLVADLRQCGREARLVGEPRRRACELGRGPVALDRDARDVRCDLDEVPVARLRGAGFAVVHRERAEAAAVAVGVGREDRKRPACTERVGEGHVAEGVPERVARDVGDDDRAARERGRPARADGRADRRAVDRGAVRGREARRGSVPEAIALEQEDGAEHSRGLLLDERAERREDVGKRGPDRDHLEDPGLPAQHERDAVPLAALPGVAEREEDRARDRGAGEQERDHRKLIVVAFS